jgi:hypothetical protein
MGVPATRGRLSGSCLLERHDRQYRSALPGLAARRDSARLMVFCAVLLGDASVRAQEIEPRAFSNAPVGVNFLIGGYAYTRGGLAFDASVPVTNPELETSSAVLGYARALDLWGLSGKVDVIVPYTWLSGTADYVGQPTERVADGFADPI